MFWVMCCYLVVEYVQPQQIFRPVRGAPLGQIVLGTALLAQAALGRFFSIKGTGSWLLLLYTGVILLSSITAYEPAVAVGHWRMWLSWVVVYFLIVLALLPRLRKAGRLPAPNNQTKG